MLSLSEQILQKYEPVSSEDILKSFEARLNVLGFENITVDDVQVDYDGDITVFFTDDEGNGVDVLFTIDPDEGVIAIILDDEESEDFIIVNLDSLDPPVIDTSFGRYIDLLRLDWLSGSVIATILQSNSFLDSDESSPIAPKVVDPYGYTQVYDENCEEDLFIELDEMDEELEIDEARKVSVVRGGKRVRLAVAKKVRRKILTGKQRASIRKAVRKRKVKQAKINRKRKRSLKVRKRISLKTPKLTRFQKVAGTANRRI